jgi:hypothetical protein
MDSMIYSFLEWGFLIVAALTPILIIVKSVQSYRLVGQDIETFRFKAVAAICIWLFLTLGMMLIFGFLAYVISHAMSRDPFIKPHPTIGYIVLHLFYFAVCYLLVDWVSRRRKMKSR